ncbi:MAG TPA: ComF family protein [Burkholderiales bacterium]|nr:ComF family protein [Burkholderiales bacterium]
MLATLGRRAASLLFGGSCYLCRGAARDVLCERCDADLPRFGADYCPRCALASPAGAVCGRCLTQSPAYDATVAALAYAFPADVLVQALKFRGELALAPLLGRLLADRVTGRKVDCIVPVPLSARRLRSRGYNQALEVARHVAKATRTRLAPELCERTRDTSAQMDLPTAERERNVRGAFDCPRLVEGTIAVLDDVMTTGATLAECARVLLRAGAAEVQVAALARTL